MNRVSLLAFLVILLFPLTERSEGKTFRDDWKPGDPIIYIRDRAPEFKMAPLKGERGEMLVPDTLDLAYRALLGLNVLTENLEPSLDYEQSFWVYFNSKPAVML